MELMFSEIDESNSILLPETVYKFVKWFDDKHLIKVACIDPLFANGEGLSSKYGIPYDMELKCLIVEGKRGEESSYAALVLPYGKRANMNATVRNPLHAKKVSFADLHMVTEVTGMEYGSITPIGLPNTWKILVDADVFNQKEVIVGSGFANSKLLLPSEMLKELPNSLVIERLAKM